MFTPTSFWISVTFLFIVVSICSAINGNLYFKLKILIPWLKHILVPELRKFNHDDQARDIERERLPILEEWRKNAVYYARITFILQILLMVTIGFAVTSHSFPYIILMVTVMLLGSMVMFFPRTWDRRNRVAEAIGGYFLAHASLKEEMDRQPDDSNNTDNSGADSRS